MPAYINSYFTENRHILLYNYLPVSLFSSEIKTLPTYVSINFSCYDVNFFGFSFIMPNLCVLQCQKRYEFLPCDFH
jgi:hypothetical protein